MYNISRTHVKLGENTPSTMSFTDISVNDSSLEGSFTTSNFIGTDYSNYALYFFESLIWRMGNYAYNEPPVNAINGQLWFDTSSDTLKVLSGDDYSNDWSAFKDFSTLNIPEHVIPDTNHYYVLATGNNNYWGNLYTESLIVREDIIVTLTEGDLSTVVTTDIDELIPSTQYDVVNESAVSGETLGDAVRALGVLAAANELAVVDIDQEGGVYNLVPMNQTRYRFVSDTPITLNIQYSQFNDTEYFEVIGAGLGTIDLTTGAEVSVRINDNSNATNFRVAYFSLEYRFDEVGDEEVNWNAIGDFA